MNPRIFICVSGLAVATSFGQGTFQNLNFEAATIVPVPSDPFGGDIAFAPAFPGWIGYWDNQQIPTALYNNVALGSTRLGLFDTNSVSFAPFVPQGRFAASLQGGSPPTFPDASIAQTGSVPTNALSLRFLALSSHNTFGVTIGGSPLSLEILQDFGGHRLYGADISMFAGQTAELRFTQFHGLQRGNTVIDDIEFSPFAIPEPSTWALLGLASAIFWCVARRRRK